MLDLSVTHQDLRHTSAARVMRSTLVRWLVGPGNWPLVLRAPGPGNPVPRVRSTHVYVHLPFCEQICPHCPYNKTLYRDGLREAYGQALQKELAAYLSQPDVPRIESLYFGGGTPSRTPDLVEAVIRQVSGHLAPNAHVGVEVHPQDGTAALYDRLQDAGVNRISLGIESFSPPLLRRLGRCYTPRQADQAIALARDRNFPCVDVNLIFGIPGQQVQAAVADVERCIAHGVDQISTYPLLSFLHTPLGKRVARRRTRPYGERARISAQKAVSLACREAGMIRSSMWSFSRPNLPSYTTVTHEDYVGFGAGAASKIDGVFLLNTFSLPAYIHLPVHGPALVMQASERLRRFHWLYWEIYRIRVNAERYHKLFARDLTEDFGGMLILLECLGWAERAQHCWHITEAGALWLHRLRWFYSLHHVDTIWERCRREAWPAEVVLA